MEPTIVEGVNVISVGVWYIATILTIMFVFLMWRWGP